MGDGVGVTQGHSGFTYRGEPHEHPAAQGAHVVSDVVGQPRHGSEVAAVGQVPVPIDQVCDGDPAVRANVTVSE